MTEGEAIRLLARWIAELQIQLKIETEKNEKMSKQVTELEHKVSAFAYWMRVGKTPARIKHLAGAL